LRLDNGERRGAACGLMSLGVPNRAFRLVARTSRAVFALKIMNMGIEGSLGVAKRAQHHAVKICQSQLGRGLRALDACARSALIGLPLEDRSCAPEVG
jgi:hypothetical protein